MIRNSKTIYLGKVSVGNITFTHVLSQNPAGRVEAGAHVPAIPFQKKIIRLVSGDVAKNSSRYFRIRSKKKA